MGEPEETVVDVLVVGAGGAGMAAALTAADQGLETILVEKSPWFGGSTARSGGGVWIPGNYALRQAFSDDTLEAAKTYLDTIVGDDVPKSKRDTYLDRGPEVMDFIRDRTPVRFRWVTDYADYYPEADGGRPGGRSVEPVPIDGRVLGEELDRLHPPYSKAPANLVVTQANYRWLSLGLRTAKGPVTALKVFLRRLLAIALGRRMHGMGNALAIGLRKGLADLDVPLWYDTELTELLLEDDRVVGARLLRDGREQVVRVRRGVILGSGGFEHNLEMRQKYQPSPITTDWTTGAPSNTGGGILAGIAAGAETDLMDDAWWGPTFVLPRGPWFCLAERNLPGSIMVNAEGRRFVNEAAPYVDAVHAMYDGEATGVSHVPCWMVLDQRYRNRYLFAGLGPRQPFPGRWLQARHDRAQRHRGRSRRADRRPRGQPGCHPRPLQRLRPRRGRRGLPPRGERLRPVLLRPHRRSRTRRSHVIDQAPFYAVKMVPGDLGTKGGLVTDETGTGAAARRLGDRRPLRRGQLLGRGHGPHLPRSRAAPSARP